MQIAMGLLYRELPFFCIFSTQVYSVAVEIHHHRLLINLLYLGNVFQIGWYYNNPWVSLLLKVIFSLLISATSSPFTNILC